MVFTMLCTIMALPLQMRGAEVKALQDSAGKVNRGHAVAAADCKCLASSDCENGLYHGKIQHCGCEKDCGGGDQGHNIHWPGNGNEGKAHVKTKALNAADAEIEGCKCLPDGECENQKEGGYKCGCDTATCILVHWPGSTGGDDQDAAPSPDASPSPETPDA